MSVDTPDQLRGLQRVARVVAKTLSTLKAAVAPGVSTGELDRLAAATFAAEGAQSGPILTYGYPGAICISVEDEVVHAIPGKRILQHGPRAGDPCCARRRDRCRSCRSDAP